MNCKVDPREMNIVEELWHRLCKPWCTSFTLHFVLMVVIIGGLGIILSVFDYFMRDSQAWNITENIISYSLALVIPSTIPILQSSNKTNKKVSLIEVTIFFFILIPLGISIVSYVFRLSILPIICMVISWCVWIIANYENGDLNDSSFEEKIKKETRKHGKDWN